MERLDYATTNGSGSRTFCLGVKDTWAAPPKIIDCSSKRFSIALGLDVPGGIARAFRLLEIGPSTFQPMGEEQGFRPYFQAAGQRSRQRVT